LPALATVALRVGPCGSPRLHLPASLRSPGVTRLRRYYGRSDSRTATRSEQGPIPRLPDPSGSPCFMFQAFRSFRLQPLIAVLEAWFGFLLRDLPSDRIHYPIPQFSRDRLTSVGLRHIAAGSPRQPAESSSSSYGPTIPLPLLPTPPRDDAVTFGYKVQTQP
jgi:hypothetical protein